MILAVTGIFLLLPLLLTVFLSGREALHIKKQWNMESLLPMLMCREIPWEYEEEMKKVQAVLTRSSLYLRIEEEKMDGEAWGNLWKEAKAAQHQKGYQQAYRSMEAAAKDTEGEMLFYQSKVCEGVFHRISSGTTRDGLEVFGKMEKGYLLSVDSNWDMYGDGYLSGHYFSEGALREQLEKAYPGLVFTEEPVENQINMYKRDKVGHILFLTVGIRQSRGRNSASFWNCRRVILRCRRQTERSVFCAKDRDTGWDFRSTEEMCWQKRENRTKRFCDIISRNVECKKKTPDRKKNRCILLQNQGIL